MSEERKTLFSDDIEVEDINANDVDLPSIFHKDPSEEDFTPIRFEIEENEDKEKSENEKESIIPPPIMEPSLADAPQIEEVEEEKNSVDKFKNTLAFLQKKSKKEKLIENAGVDTGAPSFSLKEKLTLKKKEPLIKESQDNEEFKKILTPLSGPEIALLQQELENEETIFVQIETARRKAVDRQVLGFLVGLIVLALFMIQVGENYFSKTLPGAIQPEWVPEELRGDPAGAFFFVLGLLLPLMGVVVVADAVSYFLTAIEERGIINLIVAFFAAFCAAGIYLSLPARQPLVAFLFLISWILIRTLISKLGFRRRR